MACTNCGNALVEVYCAHCGEKQPSHHDRTVGHFLHETVHELVHLDSKLFRTLKELMVKPGQLTAEYFAGRKKRYIAPIRLFLTFFALSFLAYSAFKPVAIYSLEGLMSMDPKNQLKPRIERAAAKRNITYEQLSTRIEVRWQKNMTLSSMANILFVAILLKLLYLRRYFAEHLVFSTHLMCFSLAMTLLYWPVYLLIGMRQSTANYVLMGISTVITCVYVYLALRRVYGQGGGITLLKSIAVWAGTALTSMLLMTASLVAALLTVLRAS